MQLRAVPRYMPGPAVQCSGRPTHAPAVAASLTARRMLWTRARAMSLYAAAHSDSLRSMQSPKKIRHVVKHIMADRRHAVSATTVTLMYNTVALLPSAIARRCAGAHDAPPVHGWMHICR